MTRLNALVGILLCLGAAVTAVGQCRITITSLQPCDGNGKPAIPHLGDRFYGVRVDWNVEGHADAPYNVRFAIADNSWVWKNVKATEPGHYYGYTKFIMPLDGLIPFSAVVDCDRQAGNTTVDAARRTGSFTPIPPEQAIEYYDQREWVATQSMIVDVPQRSGIGKISYMFGDPMSEGFEKILDDPGIAGMSIIPTRPFGYDLYRKQVRAPVGGETVLTHTFTVRSLNVRGNLAKAMGSWAKYASLPSYPARYLAPEKIVQSDDARVREFVQATLPLNYRRKMTPYQAARALFVAVVRKLDYQTPAKADAVSGLTLCKGDCGTYSSLYVASLRSIGIPARSVCGWRSGKDQWHCWSEMYVPDAGWMPQDPTDCHTLLEYQHSKGGYPYFFACIPDLNSRVVVSRGSTFTTDEGTWQTMQPGQWGIWGPNVAKTPTWTNHCSLVPE